MFSKVQKNSFLHFKSGLSKWTFYGKNYRWDIHIVRTSVCTVRTSAHVCDYPADAALSTDGKNPSARTWARPRGPWFVFVRARGPSARTQKKLKKIKKYIYILLYYVCFKRYLIVSQESHLCHVSIF
jgi:hypothetical protein